MPPTPTPSTPPSTGSSSSTVGGVIDPLFTGAVSADRTIAMSFVQYYGAGPRPARGAYADLEETVAEARDAGIQVELGGELVRYAERPETGAAEIIGIAAAVVILLMAFGSVIAGGMPIGLALSSAWPPASPASRSWPPSWTSPRSRRSWPR